MRPNYFLLFLIGILFFSCRPDPKGTNLKGTEVTGEIVELDPSAYREQYRPLNHFSPPTGKMGQPNGMLFHNGEYHLFYQYDPSTKAKDTWNWGHAKSKNLLKWDHLPIALAPDELGKISAGSVIMDYLNTSGFGKKDKPAMVAVFTYCDSEKEAAGDRDFLSQGLAYSLDDGLTWTKYKKNPIISNPGILNFKDPKVLWHGPTKKWVMLVSAGDRVKIYNSEDLKNWAYASEFGQGYGSHEGLGLWERPDMLYVPIKGSDGEGKWVMMVTLQKGNDRGGANTQYFVGDFDGNTFTPIYPKETVLWMDYGLDHSGIVSCSGMPLGDGRKLIFGWMNNQMYADKLPTEKWNGALTMPRTLVFHQTNKGIGLNIQTVKEIKKLKGKSYKNAGIDLDGEQDLTEEIDFSFHPGVFLIDLTVKDNSKPDVGIELSNDLGEKLIVGYDFKETKYYIDRSQSGKTDFDDSFGTINSMRTGLNDKNRINLILFLDASSVEFFVENSTVPMTNLIFPTKPYTKIKLFSKKGKVLAKTRILEMENMWER